MTQKSALSSLSGNKQSNTCAPHSLTVGEGFIDPIGFHQSSPLFSWKLPAGIKKQTAYHIETRLAGQIDAQNALIWDSGWVESEQSTLVPYAGPSLNSRQQVNWRVRYGDENGRQSDWSSSAFFELGLLTKNDWQAKWIRPSQESDRKTEPVGTLRHCFSIMKRMIRARLYLTARGIFEVSLNGQRVSQDHFANGWTSYHNRLDSLTYDVTDLLTPDSNNIRAKLGTGWYAGRLGWENQPRGVYGKDAEILLQLEITYEDGSTEIVISDETWEGTFEGAIRGSSIYDGEHHDARQKAVNWLPVKANPDLGPALIEPKPFSPVRVSEKLSVQKISQPQPGRFIFDLGQNIVGWARIKVPVEKDGVITIRFAEMLNADGTLYTANYRSARSVDTYTAEATGMIEWAPRFTFHGFRYVELTGLPDSADPEPDWVAGVVLHSALKPIGKFECSSAKINQLQKNIVWGQRGNFLDIPTDCPQRDERLGWTGDAQVFCPTAMFNYDCHAFWKSWLRSVRDDQFPDGRIPHVAPDVLYDGNSPGWMDAATIIPWDIYIRTGDEKILTENYSMMEKVVEWYRSLSKEDLIQQTQGFGDWLQPYAEKTQGDTPLPLLGTIFYARSTKILADTASVLNKDADAMRYADESARVAKAFSRHYFDKNGRLKNAPETQTAYVLALAFDLIPDKLKESITAHLLRLIEKAEGHLRTGFLGTPHIVPVLDASGNQELAYDLLFKESYPSWLFTVNQGATTMWERWNSYSHENGFGDAAMNSFNHYAYGAIGQWLYERVAGLAPDPAHPGYKHFFIRPLVSRQLDFAKVELETPYGQAASSWKRAENGEIILKATIPPNTTATIEFHDNRDSEILSCGSYTYILKKTN